VEKVSIVIRCFNEEEHIGRLLSGVMQQTIQASEIVIVDSGSTDATLSIASRYPVKILSVQPEEFSFGRSLNMGCQAASSEFIVIASAHIYPVYKDWLEMLLAPFADPKIALVYGKQRGNESTKFSERQIFTKWYPETSNLNQNHPFCNNANAAIRRAIWEQVPYDETLTGLEDLDWAQRVMELGYRIAYTAEGEIIHVHDETLRNIFRRYRREAITMKHIFPQTRFSLWNFTRLFTTNVMSDWYNAWHERGLWRNSGSILAFRLMQFWGTYRGFTQHGPVPDQLKQRFYYPTGLARSHVVVNNQESGRSIDYTKILAEEQIEKRN
jgi:rhamnosyltransferase